ncbi:MAG: TonB-dependent receptor, partial [Muribaculaceae bacterium]|nr:TonB-dependent receptor [Muribaculaceae bacterium]
TKWLQFRSLFGFDGKFFFDEAFTPKYDWKPTPVEESTQYQSSNRNFTYLWDNYFTFDHTFAGKHSLNVMAGMSAQWNHAYWMNGQMNGFLFDNVHQLENGEKINDLAGSQSEWALLSYMARANYSFDNKYLLTATVRRDGSSRFGKKHRWGTFPSASAAWRISAEDFFPEDIAVNDLKLRLGYGKTGSQASVGNYDHIQTLVTLLYPFGTSLDNAEQSALYSQVLANASIHWEEIEQFNAGLDVSLFNSRVNVSLDGYIKNTNSMLVKAAFPITTGFEDTFDTYINAGKVRNIGWELSANSINLTGEFGWETNVALTYNKNKIKDLNSDTPLW